MNRDIPQPAPVPGEPDAVAILATLGTDARQLRRAELDKMTKRQLVTKYRAGIRGPDGSTVRYGSSAHPPESWRKDELVSRILSIEFPSPADAG
ncbi:MAG: hypothetical protein ACR2MP_07245 [Streptosporangiaceae bacterium]